MAFTATAGRVRVLQGEAAGFDSVTVIIRSLGQRARRDALRRAVASVISQQGVHAECIVVFNGSDYDRDLIVWTLAQPRTRCLILDGPNKPEATYLGRALVASPFFSFLDDDDELLPGALARRVALMRRFPKTDCLATNGYYTENGSTRLLYADARPMQGNGYVQSLLDSRNWLASCGGLFRSDTVKLSYFQDLPKHREWTVVAFRIASALTVHFEDIPTFCVHSTAESESKKDSYIDAAVVTLDHWMNATNDKRADANYLPAADGLHFRTMCSHYRMRGNFPAAWNAYWNAIRSDGGWRYAPYGALLLAQKTERWEDLMSPYVRLIRRLVRNPKEYVSPSWLVPVSRLAWLRTRAACLYTLPSLVRSLRTPPAESWCFRRPWTGISRPKRTSPGKSLLRAICACADRTVCGADVAIAWNPTTSYRAGPGGTRHGCGAYARPERALYRYSQIDGRAAFPGRVRLQPRKWIRTRTRAPSCVSPKRTGRMTAVVQGPLTETEDGYLYQRFVSYPTPTGMAEWRLFIVGQKPVAVYRALAPV